MSVYAQRDTPLFGVIAYSGGTWSVCMADKYEDGKPKLTNCSVSGYGDFPYEKYPDIPVVDFTDNDRVWDHMKTTNHLINLPMDEYRREGYVGAARILGITVN